MTAKIISAAAVIMLMAIAAIVAAGLMRHKNMWAWIVAYWIVLTIKNAVDFMAMM